MFNLLYLVFVSVYIFFLPGYLITRVHFKKKGFFATFALSIGLSITLIPLFLFGAALLFHTTVQKNLITIIATLINTIYLTLSLKKNPANFNKE